MFLTQGVLIATGRCICGDVPYTVNPYSERPLYLCGCSLHRESLYREAAVFVGMFLTQGVLIATGRCICGDVPYTGSPYSDRPLYLWGCSLHRKSLYREAAVFVGMFLTQEVLIATGRCICMDVPYTESPYSDRPLYLWGCSLHRESL